MRRRRVTHRRRDMGWWAAAMLVVVAWTPHARADIRYRPTEAAMCALADTIVEARVVGADRVEVERVWKSRGDVRPGQTLKIPHLASHDRRETSAQLTPAASLDASRVFLFLTADGDGWKPIASDGATSAGVYWLADGRLFTYVQLINPGTLRLVRAGPPRAPSHPAMLKLLRAEVRRGLGVLKAWREAQSAHPSRAAKLLAPLTVARRDAPAVIPLANLRATLVSYGADAVGPLVAVLMHRSAEDDVSLAVHVLGELGPRARAALPALRDLAASPGRTPLAYIEHAITALDPLDPSPPKPE